MLRVFIFLGSLLVLALLAALIAPPFIDWDQYKTRFETEASRIFGQKVVVEGSTSLRLLPLPTITFTEVNFGETKDGTPVLRSERFQMNMELAPLLKGDIVIVDVALDRPQFELKIDSNGQIKWPDFQRGSITTEIAAQDVALENLTISDGVFRLRDDRFEREVVLQKVNARATAPSLFGPWNGQATLERAGEIYRVEASTGQLQRDAGNRVKLTVQPQALAYDLQLIGTVSTVDGKTDFQGGMTMRPMTRQTDEERAAFARPADIDGDPDALPLRLESDVTINGNGASMPAFKLDVGSRGDPYIVTGKSQLDFGKTPRFDVRAEGQQFNVEKLQGTTASASGASLAARWEVLRQVLTNIPRPEIAGSASLYFPAIVAGDTVAREVGVDLEAVGEKNWKLKNLRAQLPGRTDLEADGVLTVGETLSYNGEFLVASKQPSGFANWLGLEMTPAFQNLKVFGFGSFVETSQNTINFPGVELFFDQKNIVGRVAVERKEGQRPRFIANLIGTDVDLDEVSVLRQLARPDKESAALSDYDLDLKLSAGRLVGKGRYAGAMGVEVETKIDNEQIVVEKFEVAQYLNAKLSAQGTLARGGETSGGQFSFNVVSPDLSLFSSAAVDQLGLRSILPFSAKSNELLKDTALTGTIASTNDGYALKVDGVAGGSEVELNLTSDSKTKAFAEQTVEGKLLLVNDQASQLLAQMALPVVPLTDSGRGALRVALKGQLANNAKAEATLTLRDGYVSAEGNISLKNANPQFDMSIIAGASDIDPLMLMSGVALRGFGEGLQARAKGQWSYGEGIHKFADIKASVEDASVSGNLQLQTDTKPRPKLTGKLEGDGVNGFAFVDALSRPISSVSSVGILGGFDGQVDLSAEQLKFSNRLILRSVGTQLNIRDGDLAFDDITAEYDGAQLAGRANIAQANGKRLANGSLNVRNLKTEDLQFLLGVPQQLKGVADFSAGFETAIGTPDETLQSLTASGVLSVKEPVIKDLNTKALGAVLAFADQTSDNDVLSKTEPFLRKTAFTDTSEFEAVEIPLNIRAGVLRASAVQFKSDDATINGSGSLVLKSGQLNAVAQVEFDAGREAVLGATPEFGLVLEGAGLEINAKLQSDLFGTYLGTRLSEIRQREFEAQRAEILQRQRLQHMVRRAQLYRNGEAIRSKEDARVAEIKRLAEEALLSEKQRLEKIEAEKAAAEKSKIKDGEEVRRNNDRLRQRAQETLEKLRALEEDDTLEFLDDEVIQ